MVVKENLSPSTLPFWIETGPRLALEPRWSGQHSAIAFQIEDDRRPPLSEDCWIFRAHKHVHRRVPDLATKQPKRSHVPNASSDPGNAVGQELSQTGAQIARRNLNVQPTIKIPAGYKFTVRVNRDILFEAPYQPVLADPRSKNTRTTGAKTKA